MFLTGEPDTPYVPPDERPFHDARERYLGSEDVEVAEFEADLDQRLGLTPRGRNEAS